MKPVTESILTVRIILPKTLLPQCRRIEPDWLLMYQIHDDILILTATVTGTHSDLFGK